MKKENNESQNKTKNKLNKVNKKVNNKDFQIKKEKILDHDLFRLLGKLLYNKRYVKNKHSIEKLKKEEFINNLETPRYYDINELINDIPISINSFNELLIFNSIDHFNDIDEYSDTYDLYSFTDTIDIAYTIPVNNVNTKIPVNTLLNFFSLILIFFSKEFY